MYKEEKAEKKHVVALEHVENIQRRAIKLIPGMKHLEFTERLQLRKLPTLAYRRTRGDMVETYKILQSGNLYHVYDHNFSSLLKLHSSFSIRETRGHRLKLYHVYREHTRLNKQQA